MGKIAVLGLVLALSACGGSWGEFADDDDDPPASGRSATLTVTGASDAALNGDYSSSDVELGAVERTGALEDAGTVCRFRFSGLTRSGRELQGTVDYAPVNSTRTQHEIRTTEVSLAGVVYRLQGTAGAATNLAADAIVLANAAFGSTDGPARSLALTGTLPVRGSRPAGC